jgi:hypothetical protein
MQMRRFDGAMDWRAPAVAMATASWYSGNRAEAVRPTGERLLASGAKKLGLLRVFRLK